MSNEFDNIVRQSIDVSKPDVLNAIKEEIRPTSDQVRQKAQELINYATFLKAKNGITIADQLATLNTQNEEAVLNFSKKYVKQEAEYTELMARVFQFQNIVNEFLGQKIIMTFVAISPVTGQVTLYNMENSINDLSLDRTASTRGGNIAGRFSSLRKIKNASKDVINTSYKEFTTSIDNVSLSV